MTAIEQCREARVDSAMVTGDHPGTALAIARKLGLAGPDDGVVTGTDVARESADLILTDDNFASIVSGIREGRIVYNNIRKVIFPMISTGAAEITLFMWSLFLGLPLPLFPIQLLWLNLVTNGIQDVALAFEPAEGNELKKPPRPPGEAIFDRLMIERVIVNALYNGQRCFCGFLPRFTNGGDGRRRPQYHLIVDGTLRERARVEQPLGGAVAFRRRFFQ